MGFMKKLAVLIGGIAYDTQQRMLKGVWDRAKAEGADIHVFTCQVKASNGEKGQMGAQRIYELPDLSLYDGVVIAYNTVFYEAPDVAERIVKRIREQRIPAVCIDRELEGMANVLLDNYDGIYRMVEHLIEKHGKREIYFLGGPKKNEDCRLRLQAYLDVMEKHHIEVKPHQILEGNFSPAAAVKAWNYWTKECGMMPEAVVCVHDSMAVGIRTEAQKQNIRIPEDVILTGMDDNWEAAYSPVRLSTIDRCGYEAGYEACGLILAGKTYDELVNTKITMPSRTIFSETCGCKEEIKQDLQELKSMLVDNKMRDQIVVDSMNDMIQASMSVKTFEEFNEMVRKCVEITNSQYFYLCANRSEIFYEEDLDTDLKLRQEDFAEWMTVLVAYENGIFGRYGEYHRSEIVPAACKRGPEPVCYICLPVSYQNQTFGYCVFGNSNFPLEQYLCYSWVLTIGGAIQNVRQKMQLKTVVDKLNNMWIYDSLTGLYNRAGFFHISRPVLDKAKQEEKEIFVVFLDLDGLKKVNDTYGHEMGDHYICTMADIIKDSIDGQEVAMRYGGDEYVILGRCREYDRAGELMRTIENAVALENRVENRIFRLSVSMGSHVLSPGEGDCRLEQVLEEADKAMYKQKRGKHARENRET